MSDPKDVQFACIGCGTYNPAEAEVCAGCGYRFAGPDVVSKVRIALPPRRSDNPYEPPQAAIAPPRIYNIGSLLIWIALIAICLGGYRSNTGWGLLATITLVPAAIWTTFKSGNRRAAGNPMPFEEQSTVFLIAILTTWGVMIASLIMFCVTCFGAGVTTNSLGFSVGLGVVAGIGTAVWMISHFLQISRDQDRRDREIRFR